MSFDQETQGVASTADEWGDYQRIERSERSHLLPESLRRALKPNWPRWCGAAGLGISVAMLLALATYDPADQSLNAAGMAPIANWLGGLGASFADLMIQSLGYVAFLLPALLASWSWNALAFGQTRLVPKRVLLVAASLIFICTTLNVASAHTHWGAPSLWGGAVGYMLQYIGKAWLFLPFWLTSVLAIVPAFFLLNLVFNFPLAVVAGLASGLTPKLPNLRTSLASLAAQPLGWLKGKFCSKSDTLPKPKGPMGFSGSFSDEKTPMTLGSHDFHDQQDTSSHAFQASRTELRPETQPLEASQRDLTGQQEVPVGDAPIRISNSFTGQPGPSMPLSANTAPDPQFAPIVVDHPAMEPAPVAREFSEKQIRVETLPVVLQAAQAPQSVFGSPKAIFAQSKPGLSALQNAEAVRLDWSESHVSDGPIVSEPVYVPSEVRVQAPVATPAGQPEDYAAYAPIVGASLATPPIAQATSVDAAAPDWDLPPLEAYQDQASQDQASQHQAWQRPAMNEMDPWVAPAPVAEAMEQPQAAVRVAPEAQEPWSEAAPVRPQPVSAPKVADVVEPQRAEQVTVEPIAHRIAPAVAPLMAASLAGAGFAMASRDGDAGSAVSGYNEDQAFDGDLDPYEDQATLAEDDFDDYEHWDLPPAETSVAVEGLPQAKASQESAFVEQAQAEPMRSVAPQLHTWAAPCVELANEVLQEPVAHRADEVESGFEESGYEDDDLIEPFNYGDDEALNLRASADELNNFHSAPSEPEGSELVAHQLESYEPQRYEPEPYEPDENSSPVSMGQLAASQFRGPYEHPIMTYLTKADASQSDNRLSPQEAQANASMLEEVLQDFNIKGNIEGVRCGPVVTLYEFEPAPGTKTSRVVALSDDIARSMSVISARIAVIPGRNVIGIEIPNETRETVYFRELLESRMFTQPGFKLPIALGKDIGGDHICVDLAKMPHLLIAGTTGSGKSVAVNTMILSLLYSLRPDECKFIMIDPKMLELSVYDGIPHLLCPTVIDPKKAVISLNWAVREMEDRYKAMSQVGVRNIDGFNQRLRDARAKGETITRRVQTGFDPETGQPTWEDQAMDLTPLPYIVIVIDELADLMLVAGKEIESALQRLAQMARAAGLHLVMATQRPSVDVITGTIKANFPTRISFHVTSKIDSRTILGEMGAEQLLGMGDMLYMPSGGRIKRVHGPFATDGEVEKVVNHLKAQGGPSYIGSITEEATDDGDEDGIGEETASSASAMPGLAATGDEVYDKAVQIVMKHRKASTSFVQRQLQIGYNRAARLVEQMEEEGIISPADHVGRRQIIGVGQAA